jgi:LysM repeat protein
MTKSIFYQIWILGTLTVACLASSAQSPHAKMTTHRVTKGETLSSIARQYHVKVAMIEQYNKQISKDHKIKIGMSLAIPTFYAGKDDNTKTIVEQPEGKKTNEVEKQKPTNSKTETPKEYEPTASITHTVKKGICICDL